MGQKTHPIGLRLGINKDWNSTWYTNKRQYSAFLKEDLQLCAFVKRNLKKLGSVSDVTVERLMGAPNVTVMTSRPGTIIGLQGKGADDLRSQIMASKILGSLGKINIVEVRKPDSSAALIAQSIAQQLQQRAAFRRVMKNVMSKAMKAGAQGIKVMVSGRLGGAEIARVQSYREGRVPLHTLRADIDYSSSEALTTYGIIGIKVWVFKGELK